MLDTPEGGPVTFKLDEALARMDNQPSLVKSMLGFFVSEMPPLMAAVDAALERGDAGAAVLPVHTMKTHCANFGVQPCHANALQMEATAKSGDVSLLRSYWPDVRERMAEAIHLVQTEHLA